jgi:flagellar hook-associated protein 2
VSTFAVDGLASGLDTSSIISQLMQLERRPQDQLKTRLTANDAVVSAYRSVSTRLKAVQTAADALLAPAAWSARSTDVTGSSVGATAAAGSALGRIDVDVTSLATAATWTTDAAYGLDDVVFNTAQPPITVRKPDGTSVSLYPPSGTMRDVMETINDASGLGVRAVAIKVGADQYRLQIISTRSGVAGAPQGVDNLGVAVTAAAAEDATYTVNGIPATSGDNTVTDAVSGVTLTLRQVGVSTVDVTEAPEALADKVQALVDAMNSALSEVATRTIRDASSTRGPLASDSAVRELTPRLLTAVTDVLGSTSAVTVGLQSTKDGQVTFDRSAFLARYEADPNAVRALVAPDGGTGVVHRVAAVVTSATATGTGFITSAIQGRETTRTDLQGQIDSWDERLASRQAALERQFTALETSLARLQTQQSWLAGQLDRLNANWGTS